MFRGPRSGRRRTAPSGRARLIGHGLDQGRPRPGDSGADGADRASVHLGSLRERRAVRLCTQEGLTPVPGHCLDQVHRDDSVLEPRQTRRPGALHGVVPVGAGRRTRPARGGSAAAGDRPACEGQQPHTGRRTALEPVHCAQCPQERVLGQVVGGLDVVVEVGRIAQYVSLEGTHEAVDRFAVAADGDGDGDGDGERPSRDRLVGSETDPLPRSTPGAHSTYPLMTPVAQPTEFAHVPERGLVT